MRMTNLVASLALLLPFAAAAQSVTPLPVNPVVLPTPAQPVTPLLAPTSASEKAGAGAKAHKASAKRAKAAVKPRKTAAKAKAKRTARKGH